MSLRTRSFKINRNEKNMSVVKNGDGDETLESKDQGISFSFNRIVAPETVDDTPK